MSLWLATWFVDDEVVPLGRAAQSADSSASNSAGNCIRGYATYCAHAEDTFQMGYIARPPPRCCGAGWRRCKPRPLDLRSQINTARSGLLANCWRTSDLVEGAVGACVHRVARLGALLGVWRPRRHPGRGCAARPFRWQQRAAALRYAAALLAATRVFALQMLCRRESSVGGGYRGRWILERC
jgi:hypothetical protein